MIKGLESTPTTKTPKPPLQPTETTGRELCGLSLARITLFISTDLHKIDYYPLAPRKVFWDHSSEDGVKWGRWTGSSRGKQTKSNPKEDWKPLQIWYMHNKIVCFKISPTSLIAKKDGGSAGQGPLPVPFLVKDLYFHHYPRVSGPTLVPGHRNLGISAGALWTLTHAYSDSTTEVLLDYVLACLAFIKGVFV